MHHDYEHLLEAIRALPTSPRIIGVEGFMGAGKTHLADRLSGDLKGRHIDMDGYKSTAPGGQIPYVETRNLGALKDALLAATSNRAPRIVQGICLRDVLAKIEMNADFFVYVMFLFNIHMWPGGRDLEAFEDGRWKPGSGLAYDEHEYHHRARPHEKADYILHRIKKD